MSKSLATIEAEWDGRFAAQDARIAEQDRKIKSLTAYKEATTAFLASESKGMLYTVERGCVVDGPERGWAQHTMTATSPITFVRGSIATIQIRAEGAGSLSPDGGADRTVREDEDFYEIRTTFGSRVFCILSESDYASLLAWIAGAAKEKKIS
jgi:hypothetical protein